MRVEEVRVAIGRDCALCVGNKGRNPEGRGEVGGLARSMAGQLQVLRYDELRRSP